MVEQPSGTVTLVFTDIEGSTRLLTDLGQDQYLSALTEHRRIVREAFVAHGAYEVDFEGDAFLYAFQSATSAVAAVERAMGELEQGPIRIRVGVHTGEPGLDPPKYVGIDVHLAARVMAAGHGGQALMTRATADLVPHDLKELGEHRLRDIPVRVHLYQLGSGVFPPLRTLEQTNLPTPATLFLGRERELSEVGDLLRQGGVRLLTLTGPGGSGKTRLAIEAACGATDIYQDGVFWVPLAPLRDPRLVLATAAKELSVADDVADWIGEKHLLLLFDNFEHVVTAAADLGDLLARCHGLTVLVTSRQSLQLAGETEYAVEPLTQPEAVVLFETRARAARSDFAANGEVEEICARLDNLPLAIELAAARVKVLSPGALLARLEQRLPSLGQAKRDAPARQRTLAATIDWSHELLSPNERVLFQRLSVFRGGCTLDAAEQICDADLDLLESLVDKNLVRQSDDRFWMLETIREYAVERLEESGEGKALRRLHAEYFLAFAEQAEPHVRDEHLHTRAQEWLRRIDRDYDNFRVAFDTIEASGDEQDAVRLGAALWRYWNSGFHMAEGQQRLQNALAADQHPTVDRARALIGASENAIDLGDIEAARIWAGEAVALNRRVGDAWSRAYSTYLLGHALDEAGDHQAAQALLEEGASALGDLGEEHSLYVTHLLAWSFYRSEDVAHARLMWEANLRRARETANKKIEAYSLGALADNIAIDEGRMEDALTMLHEAYRINREIGMPDGQIARDLARLARGLALAGRVVAATRILACSDALHEQEGIRRRPDAARREQEAVSAIRSRLDDPAYAEAWGQGRAMACDDAVALALADQDPAL
jgi:predicted ATPase